MLTNYPLLAPVVALAAWTHVMWLWMYATRLPAITKMNMVLDSSLPRGAQMATLPAQVRWKADNYNHLMEEPTVFYAVSISLAIMGVGGIDVMIAWIYVGLRVLHSLVQASINHIPVRFFIFITSGIVLMVLTGRCLAHLLL